MATISQIEAYNSLFNHYFICISETHFDLSVMEEDRSFYLNGYNPNLPRADHPSNKKRGGVCIYYKDFLCARDMKLSNLHYQNFQRQCIICEVSLRNCKGYIGVVYCSPSQDNAAFKNFLSDFVEELLSKTASSSSLFTLVLGDVNTRSSSWWKKTKQQLKVHMWKPLNLCINFIN